MHSPEQELAAIMTFKIIIVKNVHVYKFCTKKYYVLHLHKCTLHVAIFRHYTYRTLVLSTNIHYIALGCNVQASI